MKQIALSLIAALALTSCANQEQKAEQNDETVQTEEKAQTGESEAATNPNKEEAEYFANLDKEDGVKATASGLRYKAIKDTEGSKPGPTSSVVVDYKGTFTNGSEFDSGTDVEFPLNRVIPGFSEGIQLMSPGSEYILYIPSELAYGKQGAGNVIPPNSTIIFEVKLSEIK